MSLPRHACATSCKAFSFLVTTRLFGTRGLAVGLSGLSTCLPHQAGPFLAFDQSEERATLPSTWTLGAAGDVRLLGEVAVLEWQLVAPSVPSPTPENHGGGRAACQPLRRGRRVHTPRR